MVITTFGSNDAILRCSIRFVYVGSLVRVSACGYVGTCLPVGTYMCVYVRICAYMCVYVRMCTCMYAHVCACAHEAIRPADPLVCRG